MKNNYQDPITVIYIHSLPQSSSTVCFQRDDTCVKITSVTSQKLKTERVDEVRACCCAKRGPPAETCLPNLSRGQTNHQHISTHVPTLTPLPPHAAALIKKLKNFFPFVSLVTFELYTFLFFFLLLPPDVLYVTQTVTKSGQAVFIPTIY